MEGQQLPKATMNSFIKGHSNFHYSAEFLTHLLSLSKEFVARLSGKANDICEKNNKKTINAQHLEQAIINFGLDHHIQHLKKLGTNIKEINQLKREANLRLDEIIEKQRQEERERRLLSEIDKKAVTVRQKFDHIEAVNVDSSEEFDYEQLAKNEPQNQKNGES